jgi:hypothetical protein
MFIIFVFLLYFFVKEVIQANAVSGRISSLKSTSKVSSEPAHQGPDIRRGSLTVQGLIKTSMLSHKNSRSEDWEEKDYCEVSVFCGGEEVAVLIFGGLRRINNWNCRSWSLIIC